LRDWTVGDLKFVG